MTAADFGFDKETVAINKSYQCLHGEDVITSPKTKRATAKNLDSCNRWRNKPVAFRVYPEENEQIDKAVQLSGLTKQDYITRRLLRRDVVVQGNPRVCKALRNELAAVLTELQRIEAVIS